MHWITLGIYERNHCWQPAVLLAPAGYLLPDFLLQVGTLLWKRYSLLLECESSKFAIFTIGYIWWLQFHQMGKKKSNDCMLSRSYKTLRVLIISSLFCLRFSLFTTNKNTYRSYLEWVPLRSSMPYSSSEFTSISQWGFNKLEACEDSFWIWVGCSGRGLRDLSEKIGNHGLWLIGLQEMLK